MALVIILIVIFLGISTAIKVIKEALDHDDWLPFFGGLSYSAVIIALTLIIRWAFN